MGALDDLKKVVAEEAMKANSVDKVTEIRYFDFCPQTTNQTQIETRCVVCGVTNYILVSIEKFAEWKSGRHIQYVWPNLSVDDREILLNGTHPKCFDLIEAINE